MSASSGSHTPGPWAYDRDSQEIFSSTAPHSNGWIAHVGGSDSDNRAYPASMRDANARLIAAAPDMLAALHLCKQALTNYIDSGYDEEEDQEAYVAAMAAIRKAGGAAEPCDAGPRLMACKPGLYAVSQHVDGEESTDFGSFHVGRDGSVRWGDRDADFQNPLAWTLMPFSADYETAESIGRLIGDEVRDTVPEQWCEDGEIVVEFIRP